MRSIRNIILSLKKYGFLINLSEEDFIKKKNRYLGKIKKWIDAHGGAKIYSFYEYAKCEYY